MYEGLTYGQRRQLAEREAFLRYLERDYDRQHQLRRPAEPRQVPFGFNPRATTRQVQLLTAAE